MKRNKPNTKANGSTIYLDDNTLAALKMQAIEVAARLPEPTPPMHGMMSGGPGHPGKDATKVIADAEKIVAFATKR